VARQATGADQDHWSWCLCDPGYIGDGFTCWDIDECADDTDNCSADATCANIDGGFTCTCNSGYTGNGVVCTDIDECSDPSACAYPGVCSNTVGAYQCDCPIIGTDDDGSGGCVSALDGYSYIAPGAFMMGSPLGEGDADETQHQVSLSLAFWMKQTEVTQDEWESIMGNNPSATGDSLAPVEMVSWWDAGAYANQRSTNEALPKCYHLTD